MTPKKSSARCCARATRRSRRSKRPSYVFYNTCSIRDKAEQKVFNRLQQFQARAGKGKVFAVLGCVAQQEGEKIFERAPHVSLVAGSASYTKLPQMLVQLEAGNRRVTGLSLDTDEAFDTPFTRRDNPHRAYITIIEGCDKVCAYCVVPFTRGPGAQPHQRQRDGGGARAWPTRLHRNSTAGAERQQLSRSIARRLGLRHAARRAWATVPGIRRVRFTTSHPRDFVKPIIDAIDANPNLCNHVHLPVQSGSTPRARRHAAPLHARSIHGAHRVDEERAAADRDYHRHHCRLPRRDGKGFRRDAALLDEVQYDSHLQLQVFAAPQHGRAGSMRDHIPEEEKIAALTIVQERQRAIQIRRNSELVGAVEEVHRGRPQSGARTVDRAHVAEPHAEFHASGAKTASLTGKYLPRARDARRPQFAGRRERVTQLRSVGCDVINAWKSR